jgi:hypothetical protein
VSQATIAAISGLIPMMFITRVRLQARTERAISAATFGSVLVRKCVAPMWAFIVPNGCFDRVLPLPHGIRLVEAPQGTELTPLIGDPKVAGLDE